MESIWDCFLGGGNKKTNMITYCFFSPASGWRFNGLILTKRWRKLKSSPVSFKISVTRQQSMWVKEITTNSHVGPVLRTCCLHWFQRGPCKASACPSLFPWTFPAFIHFMHFFFAAFIHVVNFLLLAFFITFGRAIAQSERKNLTGWSKCLRNNLVGSRLFLPFWNLVFGTKVLHMLIAFSFEHVGNVDFLW